MKKIGASLIVVLLGLILYLLFTPPALEAVKAVAIRQTKQHNYPKDTLTIADMKPATHTATGRQVYL